MLRKQLTIVGSIAFLLLGLAERSIAGQAVDDPVLQSASAILGFEIGLGVRTGECKRILYKDAQTLDIAYQEWMVRHGKIYGYVLGVVWTGATQQGISLDKVQIELRQLANQAQSDLLREEAQNPDRVKRICSNLAKALQSGLLDVERSMPHDFALIQREMAESMR